MEAVLKARGWLTQTASSAMAALKMINSRKPDLIILDLLMPGIEGQEMLRRLKSDDRFRHIPVIIVSAITDKKIRAECLEKGAVYYMSKPLKIQSLLEVIQNTFDAFSFG